MRAPVSWILILLASFAFAVPASAGSGTFTVGGGDHELSTGTQEANVAAPNAQTGIADAGARGKVSLQEATLRARGPACTLSSDTTARPECQTGAVDADAAPPEIAYEFSLRLGALEQAPTDAPVESATVHGGLNEAPSGTTPALLVVAAATGSVALAYVIWRVVKLLGLAGIVPMYSHIRDDQLLDDPNRQRIFQLIRTEPGISTKDVAERLRLAWGTVTHHLGKLEKRKIVVSKKYGKYRRYFINGDAGAETKDRVAALKIPRSSDIVNYILTHPGTTQKDVGAGLGVSSSTVLWHVKRLEAVSVVSKLREGKTVRYFPGPALSDGSSATRFAASESPFFQA